VEYRPNRNTAILWKTDHAKGKSHTREECKRRKLRMWIWLMYSIQNEYGIFKPAEIMVRRATKVKEKLRWTNLGYNTHVHVNVTRKL
jgi:hypothetical protein